jgi:hypothetical protein
MGHRFRHHFFLAGAFGAAAGALTGLAGALAGAAAGFAAVLAGAGAFAGAALAGAAAGFAGAAAGFAVFAGALAGAAAGAFTVFGGAFAAVIGVFAAGFGLSADWVRAAAITVFVSFALSDFGSFKPLAASVATFDDVFSFFAMIFLPFGFVSAKPQLTMSGLADSNGPSQLLGCQSHIRANCCAMDLWIMT